MLINLGTSSSDASLLNTINRADITVCTVTNSSSCDSPYEEFDLFGNDQVQTFKFTTSVFHSYETLTNKSF